MNRFYRWSLRLHREVVGTLYKMPRPAVEDTWRVFRSLEIDPYPEEASQVEGHEHTYQIQTNGYRIVYELLVDEGAIKILRLHLVG